MTAAALLLVILADQNRRLRAALGDLMGDNAVLTAEVAALRAEFAIREDAPTAPAGRELAGVAS